MIDFGLQYFGMSRERRASGQRNIDRNLEFETNRIIEIKTYFEIGLLRDTWDVFVDEVLREEVCGGDR